MQEVQFSGAYNGLWIVTDNKEAMLEQLKEEDCRVIETVSKCLVEVKATRQPVGFYDTRIPFKATSIILQEGDTLYMHTDGFSDQFGGKEFKKYKTSKLKRFILEISSQPISEQKSLIEKEFDHWRGDHEQIDDVCIAGIYIN